MYGRGQIFEDAGQAVDLDLDMAEIYGVAGEQIAIFREELDTDDKAPYEFFALGFPRFPSFVAGLVGVE